MSQFPVYSSGYSTGIAKLNYIVEMFVVGQQCDSDGEAILHGDPIYDVTFSSAVVWVRCGFTTKGLLSSGRNGREKRIRLDNYEIHDCKESVHSTLICGGLNIDEFYHFDTIVKDMFTDALINNVYFRMNSWRLWIHKDYDVKEIPEKLIDQCDDISIINIL